MASALNIKAIIEAVDKVTGPIGNILKASNRLDRSNKRTAKASMAVGTAFDGSFTRIAGGFIGAQVAMNAFRGAMHSTFGLGMQFESTLVSASTKFGAGAKRGTQTFRDLKAAAEKAGLTTEFTAAQAAEGLDYMALAGFKADQAIASLPGVIDLATASALDLGTASDIATDALGAFQLMSKDSNQLQKNLQRVNDVMLKTSNTYNENVQQMFEAVRTGAPAGTALGVQIEKFGVYSGVLASAGMKGTLAGTQLKMMFLRLASPMGKAKKILKDFNIETTYKGKNGKKQLRDMTEIFAQMEKKLAHLGNADKTKILTAIFGQEAVTGALGILAYGSEQLREDEKKIQDSMGETARIAAEKRDTMIGRVNAAKSAFESFGNKVFEKLYPVLATIFEKIAEFFRFLTNNPAMKTTLKTVGVFAMTLLGLLTAIKLVTLATAAFNAVLAFNPITWIVIAIAALVAIIYLLVKHWKTVKEAMIKAWNVLSTFSPPFILLKFAIKAVVAVLGWLWEKLKSVFSFVVANFMPVWERMLPIFKTVGSFIDEYLIQPFMKLLDILGGVLGKVAEVGNSLGKKIGSALGIDMSGLEQTASDGSALDPSIVRANELNKGLIVPPVAATSNANVNGRIAVNFHNAPEGTTYSSATTGGIGLKLQSSAGF